jgi:hypothetical protein
VRLEGAVGGYVAVGDLRSDLERETRGGGGDEPECCDVG